MENKYMKKGLARIDAGIVCYIISLFSVLGSLYASVQWLTWLSLFSIAAFILFLLGIARMKHESLSLRLTYWFIWLSIIGVVTSIVLGCIASATTNAGLANVVVYISLAASILSLVSIFTLITGIVGQLEKVGAHGVASFGRWDRFLYLVFVVCSVIVSALCAVPSFSGVITVLGWVSLLTSILGVICFAIFTFKAKKCF